MGRQTCNLLVNYIHDYWLKIYATQFLSGRLLDIGCGAKPYEKLLHNLVQEHVGVDHEDTPHDKTKIDIIGTAYSIPVLDASFDSALCTAVLEHLEEPELALRECYRVLKPNGTALYSVPFIWHIHEGPRDFYRFSKYGLVYLCTKAGFEVLEVKALSGFWVTFGQLFVYNMYRFNRGPLKWLGIVSMAGLLVQAIAFCLDRFDKTEQWTWAYMIVIRKGAQE
jgi:SAM-dependent methyltransferase